MIDIVKVKQEIRNGSLQVVINGYGEILLGSPASGEWVKIGKIRTTENSRFTPQEREDAKNIMRLFPYYTVIRRGRSGELGLAYNDGIIYVDLDESLFPSIKPGETICLKGIAGVTDD
jgi:hypothetical protein